MKENNKDFEELVGLFNNIYNGNVLFFNSYSARLLDFLDSKSYIKSYLSQCTSLVDFNTALENCNTSFNNQHFFVLPPDNNKMVGVVTLLLYSFATKELPFLDFILTYSQSNDSKIAFQWFNNSILQVYIEGIRKFINSKVEKKLSIPENTEEINPHLKELLEDNLEELLEVIIQNFNKDLNLHKELLSGFLYSLKYNDTILVKVIWNSIKTSLISNCFAKSYVKNIDSLLKKYDL